MKKCNFNLKSKLCVLVLMLFGCLTACVTPIPKNKVTTKVWPERLRGFSVGKPMKHMTDEKIFKRLKSWNVNVINLQFTYDKRLRIKNVSGLPEVPPEMEPYRGALDRLDKIIALAKKYNIFIILTADRTLGSDKINVARKTAVASSEAAEKGFLKNIIDLYIYLGQKYQNEPTIIAFNFIAEPHTPWILANWSTVVIPAFIKAVRSVDKNTYFIFSAGFWGFPYFGDDLPENKYTLMAKGNDNIKVPVYDPANKTIYGWHDYTPHSYTHQGINNKPLNQKYPGKMEKSWFPLTFWNKQALAEHMKPAIDFMKKYKVKMFVGEFGVVRWAPGAAKWLDDIASIFEKHGISWSTHNYAGSWDGWNVTLPANQKGGHVPDAYVDTDRLEALKKYFLKNKIFNKE